MLSRQIMSSNIYEPRATNHAGWQVQILTMDGWVDAIGYLFDSHEEAVRQKIIFDRDNKNEYRVYAAVRNNR